MVGIEVNGLPLISRVIANFHNQFFFILLFVYLFESQPKRTPKTQTGIFH